MPFTADQYDSAMQEAIASAPAAEVMLETIELRHPGFLDDLGAVTAVRVVNDNLDLSAKIEAGAPMNAGATVTFQRCAFRLARSPREAGRMPSLDLEIDHVARILEPYLEAAQESLAPIEVTLRSYLASAALTGPSEVWHGLSISDVDASVFRVTGRASFTDLVNRRFPASVYDAVSFPGLAQR